MAHYALLDENNKVLTVISGRNEDEPTPSGYESWEDYYSFISGKKALRTSYNGNIRMRYATVGGTYDPRRDAFIPPKPFDSWILDGGTFDWLPPKPMPSDGNTYLWDEASMDWLIA